MRESINAMCTDIDLLRIAHSAGGGNKKMT
jgi:hypothetical protein